ncbi:MULTISPECIES: hypothetical protein [Bacillaceae]|uniref:hypothetical protein n=1 Tax=Bacillaceae TaxID=186817 RepID=UPI00067109E5|nr:hypothetical protein [Bacillus sp. FJAT-27916]
MADKKNYYYEKYKTVIFRIVLILLIISTVYAVYMAIITPSGLAHHEYERMRSDYILMILQCVVGCIVIFLPSKVEQRFRVEIPDIMEIMYFIFLFCAIYLGEVQNFYFKIPYWDLILHCFSAGMLGALGFVIVSFFNDMERLHITLSPFFVSLFAFCFALTCGTVWEIYEFLADGILGTNMQKFMTADGTILTGHDALRDTMEDFIVDAAGAFIVTFIGYRHLSKRDQVKKRLGELKKEHKAQPGA